MATERINLSYFEKKDKELSKPLIQSDNAEMRRWRGEYTKVEQIACLFCGNVFLPKNHEEECIDCSLNLKRYKEMIENASKSE